MLKSYLNEIKEKSTMLVEFYLMIKEKKKWWLLPILIIFILSFFIISAVGTEIVLPFVYMLF